MFTPNDQLDLHYFCPQCDSPFVAHQSLVQWRVDTQSFDIIKISSRAQCLSCDAKFTYIAPTELTPEILKKHFGETTRQHQEVE